MRSAGMLMILASTLTAAATEPPTLRHNPFVRPTLGAPVDARTERRTTQRLRATLVNGPRSLANIDGSLVGIGDLINDAEVTAIDEGSVTLIRDNSTYTLTLNDNKDDQGDEN